MPLVTDDDMLNVFLLAEMGDVVNEVSAGLLKALKKNIEQIVYDPFDPKVYERQGENGGFLGSWIKTDSITIGQRNTSEIYSEPSLMNYNPTSYIHGSVVGGQSTDIRNVLDEIINEGKSGPLFDFAKSELWWKIPRQYWEATEELMLNGYVDRLLEKAFRSRGISFRKW